MDLLIAFDAKGRRLWWTGRAGTSKTGGDGWVSSDPRQAFSGYSKEVLQDKARSFNRATQLHGLIFSVWTRIL